MSRHMAMTPGASPILSLERICVGIPAVKRQEKEEVLQFETRRWPYYAALPLMWVLTLYVMLKKGFSFLFGIKAASNVLWFDGIGKSCRKVRESRASWRALDEIYNYRFGSGVGLQGVIDDFWEKMLNCQAVRNRLKIAKEEIKKAVLAQGRKEVRILSLACGSAQATIEVMAELKERGIIATAMLVDVDQTALDYAVGLAEKHGVSGQIQTLRSNVCQIVRTLRNFRPHIVEMVGLLDYICQKKAVGLFARLRDMLVENGVLITCNIANNVERHFVRWVIDWKMIYRSSAELEGIVQQAGFANCKIVSEPLGIHNLAMCQK